jgi:hypothetical protein
LDFPASPLKGEADWILDFMLWLSLGLDKFLYLDGLELDIGYWVSSIGYWINQLLVQN